MHEVVIIGAGIAGLATAVALRRRGIEALVFEQAPAFGRVGAGLTLAPNAMQALEQLGLSDQVRAVGNPLDCFGLEDTAGVTLTEIDLTRMRTAFDGHTTVAIHRARLHAVLAAALDAEALRLGETCVCIQQTDGPVQIQFASGLQVEADIVIGCDGLHSAVRSSLFGAPALRDSGQVCWRAITSTLTDVSSRRPKQACFEAWGRGLRFGYVDIGHGETYWYATAVESLRAQVQQMGHLEALCQLFDGWHAPVLEYLHTTPPELIIYQALRDAPPASSWWKGRVVLLGDAIHPTTPNMGQGAGMAIESALALANAFVTYASIEDAFAAYRAVRKKRCARMTDLSWEIGQMSNWTNPYVCALRNTMMRMTPNALAQAHIQHVFSSGTRLT